MSLKENLDGKAGQDLPFDGGCYFFATNVVILFSGKALDCIKTGVKETNIELDLKMACYQTRLL